MRLTRALLIGCINSLKESFLTYADIEDLHDGGGDVPGSRFG